MCVCVHVNVNIYIKPRFEPRTLCMLVGCSTTEPYPCFSTLFNFLTFARVLSTKKYFSSPQTNNGPSGPICPWQPPMALGFFTWVPGPPEAAISPETR